MCYSALKQSNTNDHIPSWGHMSFKIKNDGTGSNLHISQFFSMVGMNCGGPAKDKDAEYRWAETAAATSYWILRPPEEESFFLMWQLIFFQQSFMRQPKGCFQSRLETLNWAISFDLPLENG